MPAAHPTPYEQSLLAMIKLLERASEDHWISHIRADLERWRIRRDASNHRGIYGGMGSFNDVLLFAEAGNSLTREGEPWANALFEWLKSMCYQFSAEPERVVTAQALGRELGVHDAALSAFVGGDLVPDGMRGLSTAPLQLSGWRCLRCGYGLLTPRDVEYALSQELVPPLLFRAVQVGALEGCVDDVLAGRVQGVDTLRDVLCREIESSGIVLEPMKGWMRPCPSCGSEDTAVYRWVRRANCEPPIVPAANNLPLKIKKTP